MNRGITILFLVMFASLIIASMWDSIPAIKNSVSSVLDPSFGRLIDWNRTVGFLIIVGILSLILSLIQKYTTDQNALRELKKEQKILQEEFKKYKDNPAKLLELNKKQMEFFPKTMNLTIKPLMYTTIPIILFFRWFNGILNPLWGGWWILYYIIASMIFTSIYKKIFNIA